MVKSLRIRGKEPLDGNVMISGSKNAAIPCIAAGILTDEPIILHNVPAIEDIHTLCEILAAMSVKVSYDDERTTLRMQCINPSSDIPPLLSTKMRGATLLMGTLLARCGEVIFESYGGCPIGERPIDYHLDAFRKLGAKIDTKGNQIRVSAKKLKGTLIELPFPSVGATENSILAACCAKGMTTIVNMAVEPEVMNLIEMLGKMGMQYTFDVAKSRIDIEGKTNLQGIRHSIIPDRLEAGTYSVAAAITKSSITIHPVVEAHISQVIQALRDARGTIELESGMTMRADFSDICLSPFKIETGPFPAFPTDLQPQFTSLSTQAEGRTSIIETVFENRFGHVPELQKMGAKIQISQRELTIDGPVSLKGAHVTATDIRGGMALILAALCAEGSTTVNGFEIIERGYDSLESKLSNLGANIEVIEDEEQHK
ncbi:MAG: UDP-N-acetylglucosamine 1-carboxyvinyltransferase [Candidatus Thorarchaeota archaeon]|nr:UDP-N-acetylglucosamine 1-carboxyvinyltransferase [Candidatus Thorarchaeota archaeon]